MARSEKVRLGEILIQRKLITQEQLKSALDEQKCPECKPGRGQVNDDYITEEEIVNAAAGPRERLGELLIHANRITPEQCRDALVEQQRSGDKLGDILIRKGWVGPNEIAAVLAFQFRQGSDALTPSPLKLGTILLAGGCITNEQLQDAVARQRVSGKKIGEVLVEAGYTQPHQIEKGLSTQQKLIRAALITLLALASLAPADRSYARQSNASMGVSATVLAFANLLIINQNTGLQITSTDIKRGYVDVPFASHLEIKSNSRDGYQLMFQSLWEYVKEIQVTGLGSEIKLGSEGGTVVQRYVGAGTSTLKLGYRFVLSQNAQPGKYDWPLLLSVKPL